MLRAEHAICGTSSTGTGTLTLAACPKPPGGTDLYQAFNVQSLGTAVGVPVSYTIVEYTGSDFQTASKQEKGIGSLTLGASLTATTLARTTVQQTATGMNSTATYDTSEPSAVSIATAANTLVFISASAADLLVCSPYFDRTMTGSDGLGVTPVSVGTGTLTGLINQTRNFDNYHLFEWRVPMLAKRLRVNLDTGMAGGNAMFGRLYAVGLNARPTKLLYDFGTFVGSNILSTANEGIIATSATGSGIFMQPGEYFLDLMIASSLASTAVFSGFSAAYNTGRLGYGAGIGGVACHVRATSASTQAGDPANVTSISLFSPNQLFFTLSTT